MTDPGASLGADVLAIFGITRSLPVFHLEIPFLRLAGRSFEPAGALRATVVAGHGGWYNPWTPA